MSTTTLPVEIVTESGVSRKQLWAGRLLSAIPILFLGSGGINSLFKSPMVLEGLAHLGYPESVLPVLGLVEFFCALLYFIPRTSILGAILLTGYLGGATASHVRIGDPTFPAPIVFGVIVWAELWLRNRQLRDLLAARASR